MSTNPIRTPPLVPLVQGIFDSSEIVLSYLADKPKPTKHCPIRNFHPIEEVVYHIFKNRMITNFGLQFLFLDIDGVVNDDSKVARGKIEKELIQHRESLFPNLNTYTIYHKTKVYSAFFDKAAIFHLEEILKAFPKMVIVLSSDWRKNQSILAIRDVFAAYHFSKRIIDKTVDALEGNEINALCLAEKACVDGRTFEGFIRRGSFVRHYLNEHPNVSEFLMLDDIDQGEAFLDSFIYVDPTNRLTASHVDKAKNALQKKRAKGEESFDLGLPEWKRRLIEEVIKTHHALHTVYATILLLSLSVHEGEEVMQLAQEICRKLTIPQKGMISQTKEITKFLPYLFDCDFSPLEIAGILANLSQQKEMFPTIDGLLANYSFTLEKKQEILFFLIRMQGAAPALKSLLDSMHMMHPQTRSKALMQLIGIEGMIFLALRKEDIKDSIKKLVAHIPCINMDDREALKEVISLLLVNGDLVLEAKGEVFVALSQKENCEKELLVLLKERIDPYFLGKALEHLSLRNNTDAIIEKILLEATDTPDYSNGIVLQNLAKRENTALIKMVVTRQIPLKEREAVLRIFAGKEGMEEMMLLLLQQGEPTLPTQARCLQKIVARKEREVITEQLLFTLLRFEKTTNGERGCLLIEFTKKVTGSNLALWVIDLLIRNFPDDEEGKKNPAPETPFQKGSSLDHPIGIAFTHLATERAAAKEEEQIFWLDKMLEALLKKKGVTCEYIGHAFLNFSKSKTTEKWMERLEKDFGVPKAYKEEALRHLVQTLGEEKRLGRYLQMYGKDLSLITKSNVLMHLVKLNKENIDFPISVLLQDPDITPAQKIHVQAVLDFSPYS